MTETLNISAEDAEEYSQSLAQVTEGCWRQIAWAFRQGMPDALGMTRDEWKRAYFGHIRVSLEELPQAAAELKKDGLTQRESAEVLGVGLGSVNRSLNPVPDGTQDDDETEDAQADGADYSRPVPGGTDKMADDKFEATAKPASEADEQAEERKLQEPDERVRPDADKSSETTSGSTPRIEVNEGDEWYTPRWLFSALGIQFGVDVCAPLDRTYSAVPADRHLTIEDDGLAQSWSGTVWCNPPYSKPEPWARRMIHHGDGLLLTHMPMNAAWCVDVWEACDAIRLFQAMEFVRSDGTSQRPGYWLQLAAFGSAAVEALGHIQPLGDAAFNRRRVASPMWRRAS